MKCLSFSVRVVLPPVSADVQRVAEERLAGAAALLPGAGPDRHGHEPGRH